MTTKDELHRLVEELPEEEIHGAMRYLEYLRNMGGPVLRSLTEAPIDEEPVHPDEDKWAEEAWQEYLRGEKTSAEEAKRELLSCPPLGATNSPIERS